jgi:hypothetical protein
MTGIAPRRIREHGGASSWYVQPTISGRLASLNAQSIARLMDGGSGESAVPPEHATTPAQLKQLDELTTERLLAAGGAGLTARRAVLAPVSDIKR